MCANERQDSQDRLAFPTKRRAAFCPVTKSLVSEKKNKKEQAIDTRSPRRMAGVQFRLAKQHSSRQSLKLNEELTQLNQQTHTQDTARVGGI